VLFCLGIIDPNRGQPKGLRNGQFCRILGQGMAVDWQDLSEPGLAFALQRPHFCPNGTYSGDEMFCMRLFGLVSGPNHFK
jgi:hypothetical protein